ncbi:hypothetical protein QR680_015668 [Steinernema hermaphroditum]|uniref:Uncharacterized protein n=1 Tax=Steinernema hermaphroditum TaxID=289476 RepID=A0AA39LKN0_9BILA|nr:hypothetical protein QR680_015668 [Steinernema hermaphroditum]
MSGPYEILYNRSLDVSATIHIPVKLFVILVMVRHTPADMRSMSMFLLNGMLWNLGANLIFTFVHLYPMYPSTCYRADGILSHFGYSELFGHIMFCLEYFCVLNCAVALVFVFPYRYLIFSHSETVSNVRTHWVVLFCASIHIGSVALFTLLYFRWTVNYAEYPIQDELPDNDLLFCFKPYGLEKNMLVLFFLAFTVVVAFVALTSTLLLFRDIHRKVGLMNKSILDKHRRVLIALVIVTSVPVLFGAFPLMIAVVTAFFPHLPYAEPICLVCIVTLINHGAVYAIALVVAIKPYRTACRAIFANLMPRKVTCVVNLLSTTVVHKYNES